MYDVRHSSLHSEECDDRYRVKISNSFGIDYFHCWSPSTRLIGYWDLTIKAFKDRGMKSQWRTAFFRQVSVLNSQLLHIGLGDKSATQASSSPSTSYPSFSFFLGGWEGEGGGDEMMTTRQAGWTGFCLFLTTQCITPFYFKENRKTEGTYKYQMTISKISF